MNHCRIVLIVILMFAFAAPSFAQTVKVGDQARDSAPPEPCGAISASDPCYLSGSGTDAGTLTSCVSSQGCAQCDLRDRCTTVAYGDGYCRCDNVQKEGAGPGITTCEFTGSCVYRAN